MTARNVRNVAIIAHVDHGKTTLVDRLLQETGRVDERSSVERVMDSGELEKERGITILSKNTAIEYNDVRINIVDTPGHADFGGEVERVLSMVDAVLLLVDAAEGPMPQTRFVTQKAFAAGLKPILVINKIDRSGADPNRALDAVFDLFVELDATDDQLDFPIIYASAINGQAGVELDAIRDDMNDLLDAIVEHAPPPPVATEGDLQLQISSLDYSSYVGVIGVGRIRRGVLKTNTPVTVVNREGATRRTRVLTVLGYDGLQRVEQDEAVAGDIVCVTGVDGIAISDTICPLNAPDPLPPLTVDEPTVTMMFCVNTSPFAGKDGDYLTSRQLRDRLTREASYNVALRVADTDDPDRFRISGRGELHLSVLIETMRREGYEMAVTRPQVIFKEIDGVVQEPYEDLTLDVEAEHQGKVMEALGERKAALEDMTNSGARVVLRYRVPTRALMGFRPEFLSMTSGTGIMTFASAGYGPRIDTVLGNRSRGVLIANAVGTAVGFALFNLQNRGKLFIGPGDEVYEGMVIGLHSRENDLTVNPLKGKKLTNVRASGTDENIVLTPATRMTLEQSLEFIDDDELVEVTPKGIRIRKALLTETQRKRAG